MGKLGFFVSRTKQLKQQQDGLHPDEIEARRHGWTWEDGYRRGQSDYRRASFYDRAFPAQSQAMKGYRQGFKDAKKGHSVLGPF